MDSVVTGTPKQSTPKEEPSDEALMRRLAAGEQGALGPLYGRYAPLIFGLAAQTLDRAAAEEIVQEVFLAVWRKAATFDEERGRFRSWVLQVTHLRIVNELRRRRRRPQVAHDPTGERLSGMFAGDPEPADVAWHEYRRSAVRSAVQALPDPQRTALGLAFFEELTHEQVAAVLNVPLGTAKTRIRAALHRLRATLGPLVAALVIVAALVPVGIRSRTEQAALDRLNRAFQMVTASHSTVLRLGPVPGMAEETHGEYWGQDGVAMAVLTVSHVLPAPSGQTYQAWAQHDGRWTSLGTIRPDADGSARLIAEAPALVRLPDAVRVTVEPEGGSRAPLGRSVITWSGP